MADKKDYRSYGLTEFAVDNATSIFIITLMILIFGLQAYEAVPKEQFPEVDFPQVYVNTPYFGNSAKDIESLITRKLEKELQSVDGMKSIASTSIQDFSIIVVEFNSGEDIDEAVRRVKDAVDKAKQELPNDLDTDPAVLDINLAEIPIVTVNLSGDYSNDELLHYAEFLQDQIEALDEIARVEIKGELEREVKIDVDLRKMESMEVAFSDIENAIGSENMTMSAGELLNDDFRRAVRIVGEFGTMEELENMIVKSENFRPIFLKDIATVTFGYKERTSIARADQFPVISLNVVKRQGKNLLSAADNLKLVIEESKATLPKDLKVSLFNDQSVNTRDQVSNLENSIISGVILVTLVLLFFLGLRNAAFVGMAIPLSMLMGILFLHLSGVTLNIVVLFALILALGLLVDNGIVVVENIYRYVQNGHGIVDASRRGAGEVAVPIISSTATTLAAFLPLAFWPGLVGSFMQYMPITLILVLSSSLFVALVINPVFTATFMKLEETEWNVDTERRVRRNVLIGAAIMLLVALLGWVTGALWLRNLLGMTIIGSLVQLFFFRKWSFYFQNGFLPKLEKAYDRFVSWALTRAWLILGMTVALMVISFVAIGIRQPKVELFPSADPLYVNVFVELPLGTDIEKTDAVLTDLESRVMDAIRPYKHIVEAVLTQIGEDTADPNGGPPEPGSSPHRARLTVSFVPARDRGDISTFAVMDEIRSSVKGIPGVAISVDKNADGPPTGKPINLEVSADDIDLLVETSERLINFINDRNIPGIEELQADVKIGKPELIININREAARRYGISTFNIASTIRTAVFGKEASTYKQGEDEYPMMIRLNEASRNNITELMNQRITFRNPANGRIAQVPISAVADVEYSSTYSSIKRKDLDRVVTIFSNVIEGYFPTDILPEIEAALTEFDFPPGFKYEFTGQQQQQAEDTGFLTGAFTAVIFLIFIILVAQFNSITDPFIIILSVLFSTIGVFLGYAITGQAISIIFTGVGIISLAGVVVNNAIVLIDYTNVLIREQIAAAGVDNMFQLQKSKVRDSIVNAGGIRLRPVLLTAITTVLGLVPLAVGFNFDFFTLVTDLDPNIFIGGDNTAFWGPMAWTVIYGLTFATFLTLVVVPAMYWIIYNIRYWMKSTRQ